MNTLNLVKSSLLVTALAVASLASAQNLVTNGDFSHDAYPANGYTSISSLYGWNFVGTDLVGVGTGYLGSPSQEIDLSGAADHGGTGIVQNLATHAGSQYNLSFSVYTGGGTGNSGGVDLYVNGFQLGTDLQGLLTPTPALDRATYTYTFTATSPSTSLNFMDNNGNVSHVGNVVAHAVPEPASFLALGVPLALLFKRRSKK